MVAPPGSVVTAVIGLPNKVSHFEQGFFVGYVKSSWALSGMVKYFTYHFQWDKQSWTVNQLKVK